MKHRYRDEDQLSLRQSKKRRFDDEVTPARQQKKQHKNWQRPREKEKIVAY